MGNTIKDPKVADKLIPKDHFYGTRRVPLEELLRGLQSAECDAEIHLQLRIERMTLTGIKTTNSDYELSIIIYATNWSTQLAMFFFVCLLVQFLLGVETVADLVDDSVQVERRRLWS